MYFILALRAIQYLWAQIFPNRNYNLTHLRVFVRLSVCTECDIVRQSVLKYVDQNFA